MTSPRLLLAALGLALLAGCSPKAPRPKPTALGQPVSFVLPLYPTKKPFELSKDRGSVVLLDVWATWCDPCRDSLPTYQKLAKDYGPKGLKVYALNVDEDPAQIPRFVDETKLDLPILLDTNAAVAEQQLQVKMMPTSFLLDRQGVIRFVHEGWAGEFVEKYQAEIEQLLAEPPPAP